ncbi:MEX3C ligase, partial [Poecile atricapillus]|nr:MEX3C ligase [Poecile atricapillus]
GDAAALLLPSPLFPAALPPGLGAAEGAAGARGMMAAVLPHAFGGAPATGGEQTALLRRKSVNTTECVPVPSSEHVAEIVGRQGEVPTLVAPKLSLSASKLSLSAPKLSLSAPKLSLSAPKLSPSDSKPDFSAPKLSLSGPKPSPSALNPSLSAPKPVFLPLNPACLPLILAFLPLNSGATIKRIQQQTHTYIVTPSRDKEPVFEVTGMPENVDRAREEIEMHIAMRTGAFLELGGDADFRHNGTDVGSEGGPAWLGARPAAARGRMGSGYRNDSSSSLGSGSTDSYLGGSRLADFSPTSPFGAGGFWFGEALPAAEELALDSPAFEPLPAPSPTVWARPEPAAAPPGPCGEPGAVRRGSRPPTPRLSPTFPEGPEPPPSRRAQGEQPGLPLYIPAFSNGTNSYSSSNGGSASSSPPECRRRHECVVCFESEATAALVPCGHNLFCLQCAGRICGRAAPACPVCHSAVTQAIQIHC